MCNYLLRASGTPRIQSGVCMSVWKPSTRSTPMDVFSETKIARGVAACLDAQDATKVSLTRKRPLAGLRAADVTFPVAADAVAFQQLSDMRLVDVSISQIHEVDDVSKLASLAKVKKLGVSSIPSSVVPALAWLSGLRELDLRQSNVSNVSVFEALTSLSVLKKLVSLRRKSQTCFL